ncbi:sulfatase-like hydrolase/transferase [Blastopirellula sp. JC732]|uniref:Sulfatase-like hydrolase/transferase n=1 Tax=Blastopirellula sediminis TaxID=2894196 RepID=A0A9X1SH32_9BACT|nr:sulfatase-like hydrolase/transferase [Blastopirellula sediminis]MCC9607055.1 sulfatase-like hydrolase/transferase [Blastopirellula sediminis]MCC9629652.1 sulfatase-like hydrolase/transferase [Blastopirellula sediminis]
MLRLIACAVALFPLLASLAHAADKPNVLFIAVDDLNDWVHCLGGHPQTKSPNVDRLAAKGMLFERAYCSAPACNPSRASLLTGIAPFTSGVYHNDQPWRPAMPDAITLPQFYQQNGYEVIGCGKLFHGSYREEKGFDEYLKQTGDPKPKQTPVNGIPNTSHFDWGPIDAKDAEMSDYQMVDFAIEQLQKKHDKPLFLACGIYRPHLPWYVPQEYFDHFPLDQIQLPQIKEDDLADVPEAGVKIAKPSGDHKKVIETDNYAKAVQGYLASIEFADAQIGRLIAALEASPYADNTIIVLWGDHGWHLGEKLHWRKFALWEEADRVPLLIVAPGVTTPEQRCERTVTLLDLYPTLADLCGLTPPKEVAGKSLAPLLKDPTAAWDRPAVTTHGRNNHAVRDERWRYIRYADGSEELYDHQEDPQEWTNVADLPENDAVKKRLAKWLPTTNAKDADSEKTPVAKNAKAWSMSGVVVYRGQPVAGAKVTMYGRGGKAKASGVTDEEGKYVMKMEPGESFPEGEFKVTVRGVKIPDKFGDFRTTGLTVRNAKAANRYDFSFE